MVVCVELESVMMVCIFKDNKWIGICDVDGFKDKKDIKNVWGGWIIEMCESIWR